MKDNPCIRIGHLKIVDHLILGIAGLQLETKEANLSYSTLETIAMNSWDQVCDALTDGDINGAFIPAPIAMDLFSTGLDIRLLMFAHRNGSVIVKNSAAGIHTIADFKGRTVLVPSELSIQNMLLHRLLSSAGLKFGRHDDMGADVVREVVSPYLMAEMMMNDTDIDIAGFAVAEPFGSDAVYKGVAARLCTTASLWKDHPCCVFVLKTSVMEPYPDAVQEVISLFVQTGRFIEDAKDDELVPMAQLFLAQQKEVTRDVLLETGMRFDPALLLPDIDKLAVIQSYMTDTMGILKNKINVNLLVDNSYILNTLSEMQH